MTTIDKDKNIGQTYGSSDYSIGSFKKFLRDEFNNSKYIKEIEPEKAYQMLPHLRECAKLDDISFRSLVLNCNGHRNAVSPEELKIFRNQVTEFYKYIEAIEKNSVSLPLSKFNQEELHALLSCDGLKDEKEDIAEMFVLKLLESPITIMEGIRFFNFNSLSTNGLELLLTHHSPNEKKLKKLMERIYPSTLLDFSCRDLLIPKHISKENYSKVIEHLFDKVYSDKDILGWIKYKEREDSTEEAIGLAQAVVNNEKLVNKLRTLFSSDKNEKIVKFSTIFEAGLQEAKDWANFKKHLEKKLGSKHELLSSFDKTTDTSLASYSTKSLIQYLIEKNFSLCLDSCKEDPTILLKVLDLRMTFKNSKHFDPKAIQEHAKSQLKLGINPDIVKDFTKEMTEMTKQLESEKDPLIQDRLKYIRHTINERSSHKYMKV